MDEIIVLIIYALIIYMIVKLVKKRKQRKNDIQNEEKQYSRNKTGHNKIENKYQNNIPPIQSTYTNIQKENNSNKSISKEYLNKPTIEPTTQNIIQPQQIITNPRNTYKLQYNNNQYIMRKFLTWNEQNFYDKIKDGVYSKGLHIIAKIRIADLIEPIKGISKSEWTSMFNRIKSKHIDFAIIDNNMNIMCLIELDDYSHQYQSRKERDNFVNEALINAGYLLYRVYNNQQGVQNIINAVNRLIINV